MHGIELKPGSELELRIRAAEEFSSARTPFPQTRTVLFRHLGEFLWIADFMDKLGVVFNLHAYLERMLSASSYYPAYQELLAALHLTKAGYSVQSREPDLVISDSESGAAIACKRLNSSRSLIRRVKEARNQIRKTSMRGIIIVDLSSVVDLPILIARGGEAKAWDAIVQSVREFVLPKQPAILRVLESDNIPIVLFLNSHCALIPKRISHTEKTISYVACTLTHYARIGHDNDPWTERLLDGLGGAYERSVALNPSP